MKLSINLGKRHKAHLRPIELSRKFDALVHNCRTMAKKGPTLNNQLPVSTEYCVIICNRPSYTVDDLLVAMSASYSSPL